MKFSYVSLKISMKFKDSQHKYLLLNVQEKSDSSENKRNLSNLMVCDKINGFCNILNVE